MSVATYRPYIKLEGSMMNTCRSRGSYSIGSVLITQSPTPRIEGERHVVTVV